MTNLPDDWGSYYSTCEVCGERRHASGDTECACERGESPAPREDEEEAAYAAENLMMWLTPAPLDDTQRESAEHWFGVLCANLATLGFKPPSLALAVEELERERDEARSELAKAAHDRDEAITDLAVECGDFRFVVPGWSVIDGEWRSSFGGLVRHEGAGDEHGCALWSWYADAADEGDPSQTAPTARAAMRAADAAAKARTP